MHSLAMDFLQHGASMKVKDMRTQLDAFTKNPGAKLDFSARTMMLASGHNMVEGQGLAGS